ncbi:mRNA-decapping enzyme 1B [Anastrepha ludens]|uniref:mRNA-decapping enzyme 1B n=1 Tax=Anastrepha ludens TaxID=28586 RepID=UPI0023B16F5E|nr:mRNA-decapping enzyme 1B [Anastrepha ludens]
MSLDENSKARMNLAAIKKVDPYAKDIVDTSPHVAFYTFNAEHNEWEKTDVEGAFFIYSRNAQPFHSIFINNRINTTSFVEPITSQLEIQSQPPFLLYRNERSRIRGFWFYNSEECDRIGTVVGNLIHKVDTRAGLSEGEEKTQLKQENVNIFKMLSKAQQEYNTQQKMASCNVLQFFAAAKPRSTEVPFMQRVVPNTLSVEQLEKQQRAKTPRGEIQSIDSNCKFDVKPEIACNNQVTPAVNMAFFSELESASSAPTTLNQTVGRLNNSCAPLLVTEEERLRQLLVKDLPKPTKPALLLPTMFDKPTDVNRSSPRKEPLNQSQLIQAFSYLIQNDKDFVQKLHEAYIKVYNKDLTGTYQ